MAAAIGLGCGSAHAAGAPPVSQPTVVELSCVPSQAGHLDKCEEIRNECKGRRYVQQARMMAAAATVNRSQYPGSDPIQVIIPCSELRPATVVDRGPGAGIADANRRQACGNPNHPGC